MRRSLTLERVSIAALVIAAFLARVLDLDFNGPFIDESYYSVAIEYGNWDYITGDVYLWPLLSYLVNKLGGILAVRFVAALFGSLTVWLVYRLMRTHARGLVGADSAFPVALGAAVVVAATPPFIIIGTMGVYDSMALMLFTLGLWMTARGIEDRRPAALLVGGLCLPLAAATRYAIFLYLPIAGLLALYHAVRSGRVVLPPRRLRVDPRLFIWLTPFLIGSAAYIAANHGHIRGAAAQAARNAVSIGQIRPPLQVLAEAAGWMTWPACIGAIVGVLASIAAIRRRPPDHGARVVLLVTGALLVVVYQAFVRGDVHQMNKNLALALLFGSYFVGLAVHVLSRLAGAKRYRVIALCLTIALGAGLWMQGRPRVHAARHRWPDVRPAVERALALGLDRHAKVWCTSDMFVWQLRAALPNVEIEATWKFGMRTPPEKVVTAAAGAGIPCVVGPIGLTQIESGAAVSDFIVSDHIQVEGVVILGTKVPRCYFLEAAAGECRVPGRGEVVPPLRPLALPFAADANLAWLYRIPAAELPDRSCRITSLAFRPSAAHVWEAQHLEVRMAHATAAATPPTRHLDAALGASALPLRSGPIRLVGDGDGPCAVGLGAGFGYDGKSDLAILIRYRSHAGAGQIPVHQVGGRTGAWIEQAGEPPRPTASAPVTYLRYDRRCVLTAARERAAPGEPISFTLTGGQPGDNYIMATAYATTADGQLMEDELFARSRLAQPPEFRHFTGCVDEHGLAEAILVLPSDAQPANARTGGQSLYGAVMTVSPRGRVTFSNVCPVRLER